MFWQANFSRFLFNKPTWCTYTLSDLKSSGTPTIWIKPTKQIAFSPESIQHCSNTWNSNMWSYSLQAKYNSIVMFHMTLIFQYSLRLELVRRDVSMEWYAEATCKVYNIYVRTCQCKSCVRCFDKPTSPDCFLTNQQTNLQAPILPKSSGTPTIWIKPTKQMAFSPTSIQRCSNSNMWSYSLQAKYNEIMSHPCYGPRSWG